MDGEWVHGCVKFELQEAKNQELPAASDFWVHRQCERSKLSKALFSHSALPFSAEVQSAEATRTHVAMPRHNMQWQTSSENGDQTSGQRRVAQCHACTRHFLCAPDLPSSANATSAKAQMTPSSTLHIVSRTYTKHTHTDTFHWHNKRALYQPKQYHISEDPRPQDGPGQVRGCRLEVRLILLSSWPSSWATCGSGRSWSGLPPSTDGRAA